MNPAGWGVGNFIALSGLAARVYIAFKDAPDGYRNISQEVAVLQVLIDKVAQHFKSTPISSNDRHDGQNALKSCQSVLEDLHSLIEKYKRLAFTNKRLVLAAVKLGKKDSDIVTLRERLKSNTFLLNGFVRRFVVPGRYSLY